MSLPREWLVPDWPAPARVHAFVTTRAGGVSEGEHAGMNLGASSGDDPQRVEANRAIVRGHLPGDPIYLAQTHGTQVFDLDGPRPPDRPRADAAVTGTPGRVAVVLTADCLPVLFTDRAGTRVAAAHAGWRGLAAGVLESTLFAMKTHPADILAWMGPAIGPAAFEVGPEVKDAFERFDPAAARAFAPHVPGKYLADLYTLARQRLERAGVVSVSGGGFCTWRERDRFFSYRRVKESGRMGAFIWVA
ncbi:MAG: peptidoglycan editing factor PgeF [Usitatibacter sp.]